MVAVFSAWNLDPAPFMQRNGPLLSELGAKVTAVTEQVYTRPMEVFSLSRTSNVGIRLNEGDPCIIKTDVDIVFSKGILQHAAAVVRPGHALVGYCRSVEPQSKWEPDLADSGQGGFFAMCWEDWDRLHGYDERMAGWGYEDTDLLLRAKKMIEVEETRSFPLWHFPHKPRDTKRMQGENMNISMRDAPWDNPKWGML